ncbi:hypothetical protein CASFOL_040562 [Castilleja foliolosa]|uniref:Peptidase A1 domain-containing protein n=1 Tax=Castilleja foliolosa TaxID=1961234 RepID=A0ABD3BBZ3_9LAMI
MAINSQQKHILIILLLTINVANPLIKLSESARTTKFDLIHRDQLPGRQHLTLAERVKQMLYRDMIHLQRLQTNHHNYKQQQNVGPRRQTLEDKKVAAVSKIRSGYDDSSGEYFVEITMGTPPKKFLLVADTASDLTWVHCNYTAGNNNNQNPDQTVVFDADNSTSFKTIDCSSTMCQEDLRSLWSLPDQCPQQNDNICHYNYTGTYNGDFGITQGIFAEETVTFDLTDGTTSAVNNTLIGCSSYSSQGIDQLAHYRF